MLICCGGKYLPLRNKYSLSIFANVANPTHRSKYQPSELATVANTNLRICYGSKY